MSPSAVGVVLATWPAAEATVETADVAAVG